MGGGGGGGGGGVSGGGGGGVDEKHGQQCSDPINIIKSVTCNLPTGRQRVL